MGESEDSLRVGRGEATKRLPPGPVDRGALLRPLPVGPAAMLGEICWTVDNGGTVSTADGDDEDASVLTPDEPVAPEPAL